VREEVAEKGWVDCGWVCALVVLVLALEVAFDEESVGPEDGWKRSWAVRMGVWIAERRVGKCREAEADAEGGGGSEDMVVSPKRRIQDRSASTRLLFVFT
jgi:hypothetical protein